MSSTHHAAADETQRKSKHSESGGHGAKSHAGHEADASAETLRADAAHSETDIHKETAHEAEKKTGHAPADQQDAAANSSAGLGADTLQSLEEENKRLADEMLRMRAEMENSKKRLQRFYEEKSQEKNKQLLLDIISLLDNFERAALAAAGASEQAAVKSMVEGIKMTEDQFLQTLASKWGVSRYESLNATFDPSLHEAMMKEQSDAVKEETVTEEFAKGYTLHEKVLRPAKVKVTMPASGS